MNSKTKHFLISAINPSVPTTLRAGGNNEANPRNGIMLSPFSPGGRYAFVGTNMTPYPTLAGLIRHHTHAPITVGGGEVLVVPCIGGPRVLGIEHVFK